MRDKLIKLFCSQQIMPEVAMYHGTSTAHEQPNFNLIYWVTTDKDFALQYAQGSVAHRSGKTPLVYEYDINVSHPAVVADDYSTITSLMVKWYENRPNKDVLMAEVLAKRNEIIDVWHNIGLDNSDTAVYNHWNMTGVAGNKLLKDYLKLLGYDCIFYKEGDVDTYGIFDYKKHV